MSAADFVSDFLTGFGLAITHPVQAVWDPMKLANDYTNKDLQKLTTHYSDIEPMSLLINNPYQSAKITKYSKAYNLLNDLENLNHTGYDPRISEVLNKYQNDDISSAITALTPGGGQGGAKTINDLRKLYSTTGVDSKTADWYIEETLYRNYKTFDKKSQAYADAFGKSKEKLQIVSLLENHLKKFGGNVWNMYQDKTEREIWNKTLAQTKQISEDDFNNTNDNRKLAQIVGDYNQFSDNWNTIANTLANEADLNTWVPSVKNTVQDVTVVASDMGGTVTKGLLDIIADTIGVDKQSLPMAFGLAILAYIVINRIINRAIQ